MILADASVWIDHFRRSDPKLASLLYDHQVLIHPFVVGELAGGTLPGHRAEALADLEKLPGAPVASHAEVMDLVERRGLAGSGIGWVDAHLLASSLLARALIWTLDRALAKQAGRLGVSAG